MEEGPLTEEIDATLYVRQPKFDVPSGVTHGISLITAMPKPAPDHVRAAATKVRKDTVALQLAWGKSGLGTTTRDRRKSDIRIDNAWGILLDRLESYSRLPVGQYPRAARARELLDTISPNDREWLKLTYEAEWAESDKRLGWIEKQGLAKDINELAGPEFLSEVKAAHAEYGVALGVTVPAPELLGVNLAEPLQSLARSIGKYTLAVVTMAGDDAASLAVVRKALRPIDDLREGQARRARAGGAAVDPEPEVPVSPTTPIPEVK
jgi:hypothetical protein